MQRRKNPLHLITSARHMRKTLTPQEVKLWVHLRVLNQQGYHFRRQSPCDGYILDFVEYTHRLIVEVDGSQHGEPVGVKHDALRDAHFQKAGFRVLRFWNNQVSREIESVIDAILRALQEPPPTLRATSPVKGED
jgi:very-short-patch-repair endonuclease